MPTLPKGRNWLSKVSGPLGIASDVANFGGFLGNLFSRRRQYRREDTAVRRRARDLEAAGFSKTLAAGSAAQSSPIQVGGPRMGATADAAAKAATQKLQQIQGNVQKKMFGLQSKMMGEQLQGVRTANQKLTHERNAAQWQEQMLLAQKKMTDMLGVPYNPANPWHQAMETWMLIESLTPEQQARLMEFRTLGAAQNALDFFKRRVNPASGG